MADDARRTWLQRCTPSLGGFIVLALSAGLLLPARTGPMISSDGDFALHVLLGRLMAQTGGWLATEPTTWIAPDTPFIAHEWLSQLIMGQTYTWAGLGGPVALGALLIALTVAALWRVQRRHGTGLWVAVLLTPLGLMATGAHLLTRPHLVTWLLVVLWHALLEEERTERMAFWRFGVLAIGLFVLWVNLHGGFVMGFVVLGAHGLGALLRAASSRHRSEALRRFGRLFALGWVLLLATGLNPWGFELHQHIVAFSQDAVLTTVTPEFAPPRWDGGWGSAAFVGLGVGLGLAGLLRRHLPLPHAVLLATLAILTLRSGRHLAVFGLLAVAVLGPALEATLRARGARGGRLAVAINASSDRLDEVDRRLGDPVATGVLLALGLAAFVAFARVEFDPTLQPVAAVQHALDHGDRYPGRMHNTYRFGGYISLMAYPELRTSMNGFNDHLGAQAVLTYGGVHAAEPGWQRTLESQRVTWALIEADGPLASAMQEAKGWELDYSDPVAHIYRRVRSPSP